MHEYVFLHLEINSCLKRVHPDAFFIAPGIQYHYNPSGIHQGVQNDPSYVKFVICSSQGHTQMHPSFRGFTVNE